MKAHRSELVRADADLFAVYQTIYSGADTNMSYDWDARLSDTKWAADQCYFLLIDGKKAGGAIITDDTIMFPFLIPPYCDRVGFWTQLLKLAPRAKLRGVLDRDVSILPMFGYRAAGTFMGLCRPSDSIDAELPGEYTCRPFDSGADTEAFGATMEESHRRGFLGTGGMTPADYTADALRILTSYDVNNLSVVVEERATGKMVGGCVAGTAKSYVLGFVEVADICVLPEHRGRGLARYMLGQVITGAHGRAPFVKIWVDVGNPSEYLYRQMGFLPGPRFTKMERCI